MNAPFRFTPALTSAGLEDHVAENCMAVCPKPNQSVFATSIPMIG